MKLMNLKKSYGPQSVFKNFSYAFEFGNIYFIEGPSGAGKTTLLNLITGAENLDAGKIILNDLSLSYLPQNFQLMNELSVIENICLPCLIKGENKKIINLRAQKLLKELGLNKLAKQSTRLLSGGEKQRLAFGRALMTSPDVLLLDEPFNQLDSQNLKKVLKLFKNWFDESKICIWVRHDQKKLPALNKIKQVLIRLK
jgi:ABC-type lipoprotein export system ATPase subunit